MAFYSYLSLRIPIAESSVGANSPSGFLQMIFLMLAMFVFFYLILYRPERKRRRLLEEMRSKMKPGDKVTAMGILGTVDTLKEKTVVIKMIDGSKIEFLSVAVTSVEPLEKSE
ncbi:MAG: preprotein translocase subunit YajC [Chlamydiota bacterium]